MAEWMAKLVRRLSPADKKPIVAIDTAGILRYPECSRALNASGFQIMYVVPGLNFRFAFELYGRGKSEIIFVVESEFKLLPDIASAVTLVVLDLHEEFTHFDPKALRGLSFNALCTIDSLRIFEDLGYEATIKFLLENLYQIDIFALKSHQTKERVLAILIMVILHRDPPNAAILQFLHDLANPLLGPELAIIVTDAASLREYLQCEWEKMTRNSSSLNFLDPLFEKAITQLFVTGVLKPVRINSLQKKELALTRYIGIEFDLSGEKNQHFAKLLEQLQERECNIQNLQHEWLALSPLLGECGILADSIADRDLQARYQELLTHLNQRFQIFIKASFASLQTLSGTRSPVTIHKIMDYMKAQSYTHGLNKNAFILVDGMSVLQWYLLRTVLADVAIEIQDLASFAYLPSITAWSRQAFFCGTRPDLNTDNQQEEKFFREYWTKAGELSYQIEYSIFAIDKAPRIPAPDARIVAYVCNDLDKLMHGAIMGNSQLHDNTKQWIEKSKIIDLIIELKKNNFSICITSDHGNICAKGKGSLKLFERQASRSKSKRHIYCVSDIEAQKFKESKPELNLAVLGSSVYFTDDSAFEESGETIITHGGSHLLELLIPVGVIL